VHPPPPTLALRWLVRLRWWAVGAQAGVLAAATLGLDVDLPLPALAGVVGTVALSNVALSRLQRVHPLLLPGTLLAAELEADDTLGADTREDLALIRRETERCRAILARMSTEPGVHPGETLAPIALAGALSRMKERFGPRAERISVHAAPETVVRAPAAAVERALAGLVDNALRAAPAPALVRIEATERDGRVSIAVCDTGPGIPPEHLGKVGEPFFTTRPAGEGMGLGVFLARRLAEELGGAFLVESAPGRTVVTLTLPGHPA
jgi:two-component system sensor histidine kinase RegB